MGIVHNTHGIKTIGPELPWLIQSQRRREAEIARAVRKHGVDGVCRVCMGIGYASTDGVYGNCWACDGTGGRTAATTGVFTSCTI